ncbi:uncharacterized protein PAC_13939 [Phialocephala subalpina]|uniref:Uncharacterized protein n=1 Tax=Phialocephala subalpina TaxID=576137 RepID=A0A1L7XG93_9HELO|nr:uncharacterized protein PAC_13939 [Phialocephala subalpina]
MPRSGNNSMETAPSRFLNSFRISTDPNTRRKRAKFAPQRRQEVKAIRHRRACLRCSLLKIKCSDDDLCNTCGQLASALHAHEKQAMSFSGCIRTRLSEVSVFSLHPTCSNNQFESLDQRLDLTLSNISLDFANQVTWDVAVLVDDTVDWLKDPRISETSKVGTFSSPQFLDLVTSSLGKSVGIKFQRMLYAISLAYTQPTLHPLTLPEIYEVGCIAGHDFLTILDERLKPQSLKECSEAELRALFLVVFGTILAVGYTQPTLGEADSQSQGFRAVQYHLSQILAHYLLYLGSRLSLPLAKGVDQFLLEAIPSRWYKEGVFDWKTPRNYDDFEFENVFEVGVNHINDLCVVSMRRINNESLPNVPFGSTLAADWKLSSDLVSRSPKPWSKPWTREEDLLLQSRANEFHFAILQTTAYEEDRPPSIPTCFPQNSWHVSDHSELVPPPTALSTHPCTNDLESSLQPPLTESHDPDPDNQSRENDMARPGSYFIWERFITCGTITETMVGVGNSLTADSRQVENLYEQLETMKTLMWSCIYKTFIIAAGMV